MNTRCKFKCNKLIQTENGEEIHMEPVTSDCTENESFSKWTPSGSFWISVTNPKLFGSFKPGQCYYLDISEAPANPSASQQSS